MHSYLSLLKIVLHGRSSGKILLATILSFSFSIAVILCTFGLMDGFDHLLKSGLRHSSGDILISNRTGFFALNQDLNSELQAIHPIAVAPVIQTEAFALVGETSKGVLIRGIESDSFLEATGLRVRIPPGGVIVGEELARQLGIQTGDSLALTFAKGNQSSDFLPLIQSFTVAGVTKHGIYQKDLRFVYLNRSELSSLLELGEKVNLVILSVEPVERPLESLENVSQKQLTLRSVLSPDYLVRPFWNEYNFLIEAVKVEKFSISLILQLIVVIAVFNIIAFVIFIMEKKAQDFFFLRAIGLSLSHLMRFWFFSVLLIWGLSCLGAYLAAYFFNWCLQNVSFLQVPGEIYVLSSLRLKLDFMAHLTVYGVSLFWILAAASVGYWRLKRKSIIQGLRQEFS
jgi:ABC-type lipoprotein release transport system permease subunit